MTELQIHMRSKIEKRKCKYETKKTFPTFLFGRFVFDNFLLECKMDGAVTGAMTGAACQRGEPGWHKRACLQK